MFLLILATTIKYPETPTYETHVLNTLPQMTIYEWKSTRGFVLVCCISCIYRTSIFLWKRPRPPPGGFSVANRHVRTGFQIGVSNGGSLVVLRGSQFLIKVCGEDSLQFVGKISYNWWGRLATVFEKISYNWWEDWLQFVRKLNTIGEKISFCEKTKYNWRENQLQFERKSATVWKKIGSSLWGRFATGGGEE